MKLNRQAIQRMIDTGALNVGGRRNAGRGGGGGGGGVSQSWVDEFYVSKAFFARLFTIHSTTVTQDDPNGEVIEPNDEETDISNIQAMVGLWTEEYLSALGQGSGGGGGGGILTEPLYSINMSGMGSPSGANRVIVWDGSHWTYKAYASGNGTVTSIKITVPTGFSVNPSTPITASGTFDISFGGTLTKNMVLASPSSANGTPSWRALVADDIPDLSGKYVLKTDLSTYTWWGRTLQVSGQTMAVTGDMINVGNIKIDNDARISWKQSGGSNYLSMLTLDTSNNFIVGESMANSGLYTYVRGRRVTLQSGTGSSGNHTARLDENGILTVEKLKIGNIVISEDSTNGGLHVENAGIYADTYVSALGAGSA